MGCQLNSETTRFEALAGAVPGKKVTWLSAGHSMPLELRTRVRMVVGVKSTIGSVWTGGGDAGKCVDLHLRAKKEIIVRGLAVESVKGDEVLTLDQQPPGRGSDRAFVG